MAEYRSIRRVLQTSLSQSPGLADLIFTTVTPHRGRPNSGLGLPTLQSAPTGGLQRFLLFILKYLVATAAGVLSHVFYGAVGFIRVGMKITSISSIRRLGPPHVRPAPTIYLVQSSLSPFLSCSFPGQGAHNRVEGFASMSYIDYRPPDHIIADDVARLPQKRYRKVLRRRQGRLLRLPRWRYRCRPGRL